VGYFQGLYPAQGATFAGEAKGIQMEGLERLTLNKHIATIHCSNNISLLQRKIYNVLLYRAYDRLLEDDFHCITLSDLSRITGYNSKDTGKLKKAFKGLQKTIVEWNVLERSKNDTADSNDLIWCSSTLLASTEINPKNNSCMYEFSRKLAELLYQPDVYARIDLKIQTKFKSNYALALYENCLRFKRVKTTGWITYSDFRKLMGVSDPKYKKFNDFNRRVLSIAVLEVNSVSDIRIKVNIRRVSQKVIAIKFDIESPKKELKKIFSLNNQNQPGDARNSELLDILCNDFKASKETAVSIIRQHEIGYIRKKINLVKNMPTYKNGKVKSPVALLRAALAENYSENTAPELVNNQNKKTKISIHQKQVYEEYVFSTTMDSFYALSIAEQEKVLSSFEAHYEQLSKSDTSRKLLLNLYRSKGYTLVKCELSEFIRDKFSEIVSDLLTIELFVAEEEAV